MLYRKMERELQRFFHSSNQKALLITGARQVGKTFLIREMGKAAFRSFVEINLYEDRAARALFDAATGSADLLLRISAVAKAELIPGETLIFLDEVQACKEMVTAIKFLVDEGSYRYVLSGSLLGVELRDIRSVPVGYLDVLDMYPMDFEEFAMANGVSRQVLEALEQAFIHQTPVDGVVHEQMLELFRLYLIVGGMPAVVNKYLQTNNLREVVREQQNIVRLYQQDITKYDLDEKLHIKDVFEMIPAELNSKNKRFILKNLNEHGKFSRYSEAFLWLKNAGVALPVYSASEPKPPLRLSQATNLFKLFMADVGLLAAMYMNDIQIKILNREKDINFGAVYENAAAQELKAHGFDLYYFNSKKMGELDFVIERDGEAVPIEIKSGKDYQKHNALNSVMENPEYKLPQAYVLSNANVAVEGKICYLPVYMLMFLQKKQLPDPLLYTPNLSALRG